MLFRRPLMFARSAPRRAAAFLTVGLLLAGTIAWRCASTAAAQSSAGSAPAAKKGVEFVAGRILVRFREGAGAAKVQRGTMTLESAGRRLDLRVESLGAAGDELVGGLRVATVAEADTLAAIEALRARADVLYAEPDFVRRPFRSPNDPRYTSQWALKNSSSPGFDISAEAAWERTTGSRDVVVGVVDEGIDINHEDLKANIWRNPGEIPGNGIDDDGDGFVDDVNGYDFVHDDGSVYDAGTNPDGSQTDAHGTHVAGIIGAEGNNGVGISGVNWQVSIMSLKFIGPSGGRTSDLLRALAYAKMMRGRGVNLRVLNNSYGGPGYSQAELDAINSLSDAGILFVAAAGNDASDNDRYPSYPASYNTPNMIAVAGTASYQSPYGGTNYGPRTVHIYAPAESVLSTLPGNTYGLASGTSMASPHVTGAAALVLAAQPSLTMARLRAAVLYSGNTFAPTYQGTITQRRVNAANALQNADEADTTPPGAPSNLSLTASTAAGADPLQKVISFTEPGDDGSAGAVSLYEVRFSESDLTDPSRFAQATRLLAPAPRGAGQTATQTFHLPFRHASGFVGVRAVDNAGNAGPVAQVPVSLTAETSDPYVVTETATEPLTTGGQSLNLHGDDSTTSVTLPFRFTFFNTTYTNVSVTTNGELIFDSASAGDALSFSNYLPARPRVAGLWDDLRTDRRAGDDVYVVTGEESVTFRWQAVTYNFSLGGAATRGENPVSFEIELRRDGTIITRYGDGNQNVFPVVGISGGEPDPYVVGSHTSDILSAAMINLGRASTVVYTRRVPIPPPLVDLRAQISYEPAPAAVGQQIILNLSVFNLSQTDSSERTTLVVTLPAGLAFVSCRAPAAGQTCSGTPGASGNVTFNIGHLPTNNGFLGFVGSVTAQVNAAPAALLNTTATVSGLWNDPAPANNSAAVAVDVIGAVPFDGVRAVSAGLSGGRGEHSLAVRSDGTLWAWGANSWGELGNGTYDNAPTPLQVPDMTGVAAAAAGGDHSLVLKTDGTVWAAGSDNDGQLGDNGQIGAKRNTFAQIGSLSGVTAITAGGFHSLALKSDGTVWAWGSNITSESAGGATTTYVRVPIQVPGLTGVVAVAAGSGHSLALKSDGTVWAWGSNQYGQTGTATASSPNPVLAPTQVLGLADVSAISCGGQTSYALKRDGTVWSWGWGGSGERGDGTTQSVGATPRAVVNLSGVAAIDGGLGFALALKPDGTVWAWGRDDQGQLGDPGAQFTSPVQIGGLSGVAAVSAGGSFALALLPDGAVRAWGDGFSGEIGDGYYRPHLTPVSPLLPDTAPAPAISPAGGTYSAPVDVSITAPVTGAIIRYTTNGAVPDLASPVLYGSALHLDTTATVAARVWKDGVAFGPAIFASYVINGPVIVPPAVRFAATSYMVREDAGAVQLKVLRTGTTTGESLVRVTTNGAGSGRRCDERTTSAFAQCDYVFPGDTLRFAAGETEKTVTIPIVNDSYPEGDETFQVYLNSISNASTGYFDDTTTVTIQDDGDAAGAPNALDNTSFFVRQQYLDFLSREPDAAGAAAWAAAINNCPPGDQTCDRVSVSASFFRSQEFYLKGYFVFRFYLATLGRIPQYGEMASDMTAVTASTTEELVAKRDQFARDWLTRQEFRSTYDQLSNAAFVNALYQTAGISTVTGIPRDTLTADLQAGRRTRSEIVRLVVESPEADARVYNPAFVAMQYYGYLRRTPEAGGYANWLRTINANPSDIRSMVNGFVNSYEYRLRFGQP